MKRAKVVIKTSIVTKLSFGKGYMSDSKNKSKRIIDVSKTFWNNKIKLNQNSRIVVSLYRLKFSRFEKSKRVFSLKKVIPPLYIRVKNKKHTNNKISTPSSFSSVNAFFTPSCPSTELACTTLVCFSDSILSSEKYILVSFSILNRE